MSALTKIPRILTLCSHIEKVRESVLEIHVQCSNTLRLFEHL